VYLIQIKKTGDIIMGYENMGYDLEKLFKRYKGQPIEVITESGMKYCGILAYAYDGYIELIDGRGRTIRIEDRKIEAIVEPRMRLHRLCDEDDCCCEEEREHKHKHKHKDECCFE